MKFFHRSGIPAIPGNTLTPFAESALITSTGHLTKATLATPVAIQAGDLIGLTFVGSCFSGMIGEAMPVEGGVEIFSDPSTSFDLTTVTPRTNFPAVAFGIFGSSDPNPEVRSRIIVAAASAAGVGGSSFKTDIQLIDSPSDPSVPFTLAPGQSRTIQDFVGSIGRTGKGSIDVCTTVGFEPVVAVARLRRLQRIDQRLHRRRAHPQHAIHEDAVLFGPTDPSRFRMNVGVRTLDQPANISFYVIKSDGTQRAQPVTKSYPANDYVQNEESQITGAALQAGDSVVVTPDAPAFIYSSIIDNTSLDPSLQLASTVR